MKRKIIILTLLTIISFIFPYHPQSDARKNPFRGILPPERLSQDRTAEEVITVQPEEVKPAAPDIYLVVNIPARKVMLYDEGREVARHDVAVGQPVYKTPTGPQEIDTIIWNPWWIPPDSPWARGASKEPPGPRNPLGPVKLLMGQGIRLHGTNKDSSVGRAASHGCLRMHNDEAAQLAWYIQKRLNNSEESLLEKYKRYRGTSFYVKLNTTLRADIIYEPVEVRNDTIYIYPDLYRSAKDIKTEIIHVLMKNGIDIRGLNADKIASLQYPKNQNEVKAINLADLFAASVPGEEMSYAVLE